ncbi:MAG: hypothetical protein ACK4OM_02310 [Alphaproteobacteria bacterium]
MNKFAKISAVLATASLIAGVSSVAFSATTAEVKANEKSATVGTAIDDAGITTKVKAALLADERTKGLTTGVETINGVVNLTNLKTAEEAKAAEEVTKEAVKDYKGFKEVTTHVNAAQ